jgi:diketogulonate reductase-like aldo/keto reductase
MASISSQTSSLSKDLVLPPPEGGNDADTGAGAGADAGADAATTSAAVTIPRLVYGTAWKKDRTADLVQAALAAGFRGVDTAAQPRHYREDLVAEGVRRALAAGTGLPPGGRAALYLQTKFTPLSSQDRATAPYDPTAPLAEQVRRSIEASLANFTFPGQGEGDSYLDCVVLHSPLPSLVETEAVWAALSAYVPARVRRLGISNAPPGVVAHLCSARGIAVRPAVVQNRFYPDTAWEGDLRAFCRARGVVFQTFWTLSGNPRLVHAAPVARLAAAAGGVEPEVAFYALVLGLGGTTILDGTTSAAHMTADLEGIEKIGQWAEGEGAGTWAEVLGEFKTLIKEEED